MLFIYFADLDQLGGGVEGPGEVDGRGEGVHRAGNVEGGALAPSVDGHRLVLAHGRICNVQIIFI